MRCLACDRSLTDYEATRKHALTGTFIDLCQQCFKAVQADSHLPTKDRKDLISSDDIDDGLEGNGEDDCHVSDTNTEGDH
jgi:hypothetical protein